MNGPGRRRARWFVIPRLMLPLLGSLSRQFGAPSHPCQERFEPINGFSHTTRSTGRRGLDQSLGDNTPQKVMFLVTQYELYETGLVLLKAFRM